MHPGHSCGVNPMRSYALLAGLTIYGTRTIVPITLNEFVAQRFEKLKSGQLGKSGGNPAQCRYGDSSMSELGCSSSSEGKSEYQLILCFPLFEEDLKSRVNLEQGYRLSISIIPAFERRFFYCVFLASIRA
jgi:hypothetical protein